MAWSLDSVLNVVEKNPEKALKKLDSSDLVELPERLTEIFASRRPDLEDAKDLLRLAALTDTVHTLPAPEVVQTLKTPPFLRAAVFVSCAHALSDAYLDELLEGLDERIQNQLVMASSGPLKLRLLTRLASEFSFRALEALLNGMEQADDVLWSQRSRIDHTNEFWVFQALPKPAHPRWLTVLRDFITARDENDDTFDLEEAFGPKARDLLRATGEDTGKTNTTTTEEPVWMGPFDRKSELLATLDQTLAASPHTREDDTGDLVHLTIVQGNHWWVRVPGALASLPGFCITLTYDPENEWGPPVGYQVRDLQRAAHGLQLGPLVRTVERDLHPDDGWRQAALEEVGQRDSGTLSEHFEEIGVHWNP